jgi:hypothetical protein
MSTRKPEDAQLAAVQTARNLISGDISLLDGCVHLSQLSHQLVPDWRLDPDLVIFGVVASDCDHLPLGEVRKLWSRDALVKADAEIEKLTAFYQTRVFDACISLIARFSRAN